MNKMHIAQNAKETSPIPSLLFLGYTAISTME